MSDFEFHEDTLREPNALFERWLEEHKSEMCRLEFPVIDDYILVVAYSDIARSGQGGFTTLKTVGSPTYRIRGLLEVGLDIYSAPPPMPPPGG